MPYSFLKTTADNPDFHILVTRLNAHFAVLNGEKDDFYAQFNQVDAIKHVILVYDDQTPIACGAIKAYSESFMEIKRMYVVPDQRGRSVASLVLTHLENWAKELGYAETILETLKNQTHVINMYARNGYQTIANYGQYEGVESSVCMCKKIQAFVPKLENK